MSVVLNMWGKDHAIQFYKTKYSNNNNLAIVANELMDDGYEEPYSTVTVNLNNILPSNQAYLDINNCPDEIIHWLFDNGYAEQKGVEFSGFCMYPLVEFSKAFMETILIEI